MCQAQLDASEMYRQHQGTILDKEIALQARGLGLGIGGLKPTRVFRHVGVPVPALGPVPLMVLQGIT